MGQQHFYVPDDVEELIQRKAKEANLSVSRFLADLVKRELTAGRWPDRYFDDVFGKWAGEPLERAPQGTPDVRDELE